jgi:fused signal recognition particle receptor
MIRFLRLLALLAVILTLLTIALGTYIRAASVGQGCPDWPGCFGWPITLEDLGAPLGIAMGPSVDVAKIQTHVRTHRYLAGAVGVAILMLSALVWTLPRHRVPIIFWTIASLSLVILQALLGLWTLEHHLLPLAVTGHLLLGFALLLSLYRLYLDADQKGVPATVSTGPRWLARFALLVLFGQLALGGWTSNNAAGLACPDFPGCLGQNWPDVDYREGFTLWRKATQNAMQEPPPLAARAAIHWSHRLGGVVAYLIITALAIVISTSPRLGKLRKAAILMSVLVLAETALGVAAIVMRLPIAIVVAHAIVAGLLSITLAYTHFHLVGSLTGPKPKPP